MCVGGGGGGGGGQMLPLRLHERPRQWVMWMTVGKSMLQFVAGYSGLGQRAIVYI